MFFIIGGGGGNNQNNKMKKTIIGLEKTIISFTNKQHKMLLELGSLAYYIHHNYYQLPSADELDCENQFNDFREKCKTFVELCNVFIKEETSNTEMNELIESVNANIQLLDQPDYYYDHIDDWNTIRGKSKTIDYAFECFIENTIN